LFFYRSIAKEHIDILISIFCIGLYYCLKLSYLLISDLSLPHINQQKFLKKFYVKKKIAEKNLQENLTNGEGIT